MNISKTGPIFLLLFFMVTAALEAKDWGWPEPATAGTASSVADAGGDPLFERLITWYKTDISPKQGSRCAFHPSCSTYTLYCMKHYGFAAGFFMGLERIYIRENRGLFMPGAPYEKIYVNGALKYYDHPEANRPFVPKNWTHYNAYFITWPADSPVFNH